MSIKYIYMVITEFTVRVQSESGFLQYAQGSGSINSWIIIIRLQHNYWEKQSIVENVA